MNIFYLRTISVIFWMIQMIYSSIIGNSYNFGYSIHKDGVLIQHSEARKANHTIGSYSVLQPDGLIRDVRYEVKENGGYNAVVDYRAVSDGSYAFGYEVDDFGTNNVQFRDEERHADGRVEGSYGFLASDGSVYVVHYDADKMGYRAKVEGPLTKFYWTR